MTTGENIKILRKQMNLSQDELANLAGYTDRSTIAKIESGKIDLTESKIIQFSRIFDVTPAALMGYTPLPVRPAVVLTSDEQNLISAFQSLNTEGQIAAMAMMSGLTSQPKYKKT